jgi:hypothetical protein
MPKTGTGPAPDRWSFYTLCVIGFSRVRERCRAAFLLLFMGADWRLITFVQLQKMYFSLKAGSLVLYLVAIIPSVGVRMSIPGIRPISSDDFLLGK